MQVEIYGIDINKEFKKDIQDFFIEKIKQFKEKYSIDAFKIISISIFVEMN